MVLRLSTVETQDLLERLQKRYDEQESGFALLRFGPDRWQ
ncbi:SMC-Scp complex subunit ScpB, partial [Gemmiger formicilis]|nr:SMC-Scp complex subunit ScpB [Gemmiger formicilis]